MLSNNVVELAKYKVILLFILIFGFLQGLNAQTTQNINVCKSSVFKIYL